ncbi:Rv3235 family protein [Mycobacterium sp. NPDC003449]
MTTAEPDPQATPEFTARQPCPPASLTSPVIDYEPPAHPLGAPPRVGLCPAPPALHGHPARRLRLVTSPPQVPVPPPPGAAQFADLTLRRTLEVVDRRRPPAQLRTLMSPLVIDVVVALARSRPGGATAKLRRVRLGAADAPAAAEVFATYTRAGRVRAIAARVEIRGGRWQMTALQIG